MVGFNLIKVSSRRYSVKPPKISTITPDTSGITAIWRNKTHDSTSDTSIATINPAVAINSGVWTTSSMPVSPNKDSKGLNHSGRELAAKNSTNGPNSSKVLIKAFWERGAAEG